MKHFLLAALAVLCLAAGASAGLPTDPNTRDAWFTGAFEPVRVFYQFSSKHTGDPEVNEFVCRVDYYHDGRLRLLAVVAPTERDGAPFAINTFYSLEQSPTGQFGGTRLVRNSSQTMRGRGFRDMPALPARDPFSWYCAAHLADLFGKIPGPEAKMFHDQYGELFGIK